jgi:predicted nuclease of predicted toxin-antitoxin system
MRFYADENFPAAVVIELRRLGHDVLTVFEDGRANKNFPDEKVLTRAIKLDRIVLTINRVDFIRLHRKRKEHSGIVACTQDFDFIGQAQRIVDACSIDTNLDCKLIRVYKPS